MLRRGDGDITGRIEAAGEVWATCRMLVDVEGRGAIWRARGYQNDLAWSGRVATLESHAPGAWTLIGADGQTFTIVRARCGCGTALGSLGEMDLARLGVTV
ncbi:MAG TPA: hypothetical protein VGL21_07805 [Jatrophihabitantaceae bacterium]